MEPYVICLDVGGTEIKAAALTPSGNLLSSILQVPAHAQANAEALLAHFIEIIHSLHQPGHVLSGVSFAFPGPFDYTQGICLLRGLNKYDALFGCNLRETFSRSLFLPSASIRFMNDVSAFALGELHFGHAKDSVRSMFVCIGTGCGSAFSLGNQLAPEGTPGVPPNGYIYPTPMLDGCMDDYISRRGLMALSTDMLGTPLDGKELAQRVADGDNRARACYETFGQRLREGLIPFLDGFMPDHLCLGGQITRSADLFLAPLRSACRVRNVTLCITADTTLRALQGLIA